MFGRRVGTWSAGGSAWVLSCQDGGVEVTLTIENASGEQGTVQASGADYETAYAAARALVPDDFKAIVIRTDS